MGEGATPRAQAKGAVPRDVVVKPPCRAKRGAAALAAGGAGGREFGTHHLPLHPPGMSADSCAEPKGPATDMPDKSDRMHSTRIKLQTQPLGKKVNLPS